MILFCFLFDCSRRLRYGIIFTREYADLLKKTNILIYVYEDTSIGIVNLDAGKEMLHWKEGIVLGRESSILLYVLADEFEWLIYKSQEVNCGFCLAIIPRKHPAKDEIIKKVDALEQFKAYRAMEDLLIDSYDTQHLPGYWFRYNGVIKEMCMLPPESK